LQSPGQSALSGAWERQVSSSQLSFLPILIRAYHE
jgi:hypothetical protein